MNDAWNRRAVNTGIRHAHGLFTKVADSDDWLDRSALRGGVSDGTPSAIFELTSI